MNGIHDVTTSIFGFVLVGKSLPCVKINMPAQIAVQLKPPEELKEKGMAEEGSKVYGRLNTSTIIHVEINLPGYHYFIIHPFLP